MEQSPGHLLIQFNVSDLEKATKGFKPSYKIGEGDFGAFYKGIIKLSGKRTHVLIQQIQGHVLKAKVCNYFIFLHHLLLPILSYITFHLFSFMYTPIWINPIFYFSEWSLLGERIKHYCSNEAPKPCKLDRILPFRGCQICGRSMQML